MFKTITTLAGAFGVALIGSLINEILDQKSIQIFLEKEYMATFFVVLSFIFMLNFKNELHKIKNIEIGRQLK